MSATILRTPAGFAHQLATGGWLVDVGDAFPTWRPDRESALDLLDVPTISPAGPDDLARSSFNDPVRSGPNLLDP